MYSDRGIDVGGLTFGKGRLRMSLENVDGRPSLVIRGDNRATVVFDLGRINITPAAGDPATPIDGDIWYDDTSGLFQFRQEGTTESLSGDDAPVDGTYVVSSANATLTAELVLGTDVIMAGTAAARPAAGTAGRIYFSTDTNALERDTGAAWQNLLAGAGVTDAQYVTLATHASLTAERVLTGTALQVGLTDAGANGNITLTLIDPLPPSGRLSLVTAVPVQVTETANVTTVYYTPYFGNVASLYNGTNWIRYNVAEISIAMAASANWAANSVFDLYLFADAGTVRLVTGAAWTSDTARNETLTRLNGLWTNNASMTGRYGASSTVTVGANQGLYVGSVRTTGSAGTTTWELGGIAANGDPALLYLWNMYNRALVAVNSRDSTASWTYQTNTWRSQNASDSCRVTFLRGLNEDGIWALHGSISNPTSSASGQAGVGLDTTSANSGLASSTYRDASSVIVGSTGLYAATPGLGLHFVQAVEKCDTVTAALTFYGTGAAASGLDGAQSGLTYMGMH